MKSNYEELLYGMLNVYMFLLDRVFVPYELYSPSYNGKEFHPIAWIKYDRHVVDEVLAGRSQFKDFNPVAAGIFLYGGAVPSRD